MGNRRCRTIRIRTASAGRTRLADAGCSRSAYIGAAVVGDRGGRGARVRGMRLGGEIAASLLWLWVVERARPDRWDIIGVAMTHKTAAGFLPRCEFVSSERTCNESERTRGG